VYGWLAVAFVGLFMMIEIDFNHLLAQFNSNDSRGSAAFVGIALSLGAAILYTVTTLVTKKIAKVPPDFVAFVQVLLGIFMLLPLADFTALPGGCPICGSHCI